MQLYIGGYAQGKLALCAGKTERAEGTGCK